MLVKQINPDIILGPMLDDIIPCSNIMSNQLVKF